VPSRKLVGPPPTMPVTTTKLLHRLNDDLRRALCNKHSRQAGFVEIRLEIARHLDVAASQSLRL
jgi:hypothetical protein